MHAPKIQHDFTPFVLQPVYPLLSPFWPCTVCISGSPDPHILFSISNIFSFQAMSPHDQEIFVSGFSPQVAFRFPVTFPDLKPPRTEDARRPQRWKLNEDIIGNLVRSPLQRVKPGCLFDFCLHVSFAPLARWLGSFLLHQVNTSFSAFFEHSEFIGTVLPFGSVG